MNGVRRPVVAGKFYPGQADILKNEVEHWLDQPEEKSGQPWAVMLPHAGYFYCGEVIGKTLNKQKLPKTLIILCPNHTGVGTPLSVWAEGAWQTPLGLVPVAADITSALLTDNNIYAADMGAHMGEHSIEVLLPFLQMQVPELSIAPVCVGTQNPQILSQAGKILANVLKENPQVGLVVSSDMNHYENEGMTIKKDSLALDKALAADPEGLLKTVKANGISMCGAGPLALALFAAQDLGGLKVELVDHITSAKASGDQTHTVGYAGLRLYLKAA